MVGGSVGPVFTVQKDEATVKLYSGTHLDRLELIHSRSHHSDKLC